MKYSVGVVCCGEKRYTKFCADCGKQLQVPCKHCGQEEPYNSVSCRSRVIAIEQQISGFVEERERQSASVLENWSRNSSSWLLDSADHYIIWTLGLMVSIIVCFGFVLFNWGIVPAVVVASVVLLIGLFPLYVHLYYLSRRRKHKNNHRREWLQKHPVEAVTLRLVEADDPNG